MRDIDAYIGLVPPLHRRKPKFEAELRAILAPLADLQVFLQGVPRQFDLDIAIGAQLDVDGEWIGRSRFIPEPLPNVWFSFDIAHKGFDEGYWKGPFDVGELFERLDDDTYRRLLRAKIAANGWNGQVPSAQAILNIFFNDPATYIMVEDRAFVATTQQWFAFDDPARGFDSAAVWYQTGDIISTLPELDMAVTIGVAGKIPSIVDLEILAQNLIPLHIGGVDQDISVTSVGGAPLFGFDIQNQYIAGFDTGAWGVTPEYMVDQLTA